MADNLVVFRAEKLKTLGDVSAAAAHNARLRDTPNASKGGSFYELIDRGGSSVLDEVRRIHSEITELCKENKWYQRPDSVAAAEILISASPEYFRPGQPEKSGFYEKEKLDAWLDAVVPWIKKEIGAQVDIVSICVHLDEATPHIQVIGVPRNHRGELSYRSVFGGDNKGDSLSEWQTRAAEPVAHLGIQRGVMGSRAKHRKIKDFYAAVNAETAPIPAVKTRMPKPLPPASISELIPFTDAKAQRVDLEKETEEQAEKHRKEMRAAVDAKLKAFPILEQQAKDVKAANRDKRQAERAAVATSRSLDAAKAEAAQVRGLPLDAVLTKMYGAVEASDSKPTHKSRKFDLPDGTQIAVTGELWVEQGGGGGKQAINLVMHLEQYAQADFKKAVGLLVDSFGGSATASELTRNAMTVSAAQVKVAESEPVPAPEPELGRWPKVRDWLIDKRGLPAKLVEKAYKAGVVYADKIGNAVFPRERGGAFIRGTGDTRFFRTVGSTACGGVVVGGKDEAECWVCESVIDALSIKAVHPKAHVLATGGNAVGAKAAAGLVPKSALTVHLAFDNDTAGQRMATQMTALITAPGRKVIRSPAPAGKDWNEAINANPDLISGSWIVRADKTTPELVLVVKTAPEPDEAPQSSPNSPRP